MSNKKTCAHELEKADYKTANKLIFRELKSKGFWVNIAHTRAVKNGFLFSHMRENGGRHEEVLEDCITRKDFFNSSEPTLVTEYGIYDVRSSKMAIEENPVKIFGETISSCGGFTQVEIIAKKELPGIIDAGTKFVGKYNFPRTTQYNRAEGFYKAFMNAKTGKLILSNLLSDILKFQIDK